MFQLKNHTSMNRTNKELAEIFGRMAAIYELKEDGNEFRVRAYENAARVLDTMVNDVRDMLGRNETLEDIHGIGESIADKIREYVASGKIQKYEQLRKDVPEDFFELLKVEGIGPKTLLRLRNELKIKTRKELIEALESGAVEHLKGFGPRLVENLLEGIARRAETADRILLAEAREIAEEVKLQLLNCCQVDQLEVAGSIRRHRPTIGDIDLLVTAPPSSWPKIMDCFTEMELVKKVINKGTKKASVQIGPSSRDVDLRLFEANEFGAAMLYFTGSKAHNVQLRKMARDKNWKINEYGLYSKEKKLAGKTEASIYKKLGLHWIPPELREDKGELEWATKRKVPELIQFEAIRGDLHLHSTWSDGNNTIREIAAYLLNNFAYEYFVVTDHSRSQVQAGGLDETELRRQAREIDQLNKELGRDFIKCGVEVDILADGKLDLPDSFLQTLDWVVASIHSRFKQDNTERLLQAMENPYVHVIGHPNGRLLKQREPYKLDMEKVLEQAAVTGTALEINVSPQRMDLDEQWIRAAQEKGVTLVLVTDSHSLGDLRNMRVGAGFARRGWCRPETILNTGDWKSVKAFAEKKRERVG
jgi:DNA polymerase (family 10)